MPIWHADILGRQIQPVAKDLGCRTLHGVCYGIAGNPDAGVGKTVQERLGHSRPRILPKDCVHVNYLRKASLRPVRPEKRKAKQRDRALQNTCSIVTNRNGGQHRNVLAPVLLTRLLI